MELQVSATRMELLKLGRRMALAKRGHKLLKDKLDGLIQDFIKTSKGLRSLYEELRSDLLTAFSRGAVAAAGIDKQSYEAALLYPTHTTEVEEKKRNLMGVRIPSFTVKSSGEAQCFGDMFFTDGFISSVEELKNLLPKMIKLAELYKALERIGEEIIEIKRRVNALEYILIPELEAKIRYIKMKLAEMERGTIVSLLKIKELVEKSRV